MASSTIPVSATATSTSTGIPSCITMTPGKYGYVPPEACNANYAYSPSFAAAIAFSTLFGLCTMAQVVEAILFRKGFCWVMIMGCTWELVSFITRAIGAHDQQQLSYAYISQLLFLLAPLWINAYAYMTAGRLIWTFHPEKRIWKIKAMSIGKYFVLLDIFSFIVQGAGGSMLSPGNDQNTQKVGKNIYMTGVGVQELFIVLFTALIVRFHMDLLRLEREGQPAKSPKWKWLTYALYACLALITTRIIFRLAEFSAGTGVSNPLPYHEAYPLALDAVPMFLAITILTVIHPGMVLQGPESEFPSRKEKKAMKKAAKAEKKARKQEAKMGRSGGFNGDTAYSPIQHENDSNEHILGDVEMGSSHQNRFQASEDYSRESSHTRY